jgi:Na+/proline symporter
LQEGSRAPTAYSTAVNELRLDVNLVDYSILIIYFIVVLGIGFAARRYIRTSLDYFLSGRSLPAWITGLAFISANLGALEVLGQSANGAQYGVAATHFFWIGAIPAMVFLGIVMMPFYYGSKVRSVPEYLRLRFNNATHFFNAMTFALATVLIAGVNLYALALVLNLLLGWPILLGIVVSAGIVLVYITLGGLSSAIYNEVLQFFVILAALIPAIPKIFVPFITILPGLIALVVIQGLGTEGNDTLQYNNAIPLLMDRYLPNGMLGLALTGLIAAFMAGVAANVSAFNTVVTYDLWEPYVRPGKDDAYYLRFGRLATIGGILVGIFTALIASGYDNIQNYIQLLFSFFNAPLFATFIIGMFWKRMTPWAGFWGLVAGTFGAAATYASYKWEIQSFGSDLSQSFWGAIVAFLSCAAVTVLVSMFTQPKPVAELQGLVYGMANTEEDAARGDQAWYRSPTVLGVIAIGLASVFSLATF